MSPALASGFRTPEPPGKLSITLFVLRSVCSPIQNDTEEVKTYGTNIMYRHDFFFLPLAAVGPCCYWWAFSSCSQ